MVTEEEQRVNLASIYVCIPSSVGVIMEAEDLHDYSSSLKSYSKVEVGFDDDDYQKKQRSYDDDDHVNCYKYFPCCCYSSFHCWCCCENYSFSTWSFEHWISFYQEKHYVDGWYYSSSLKN